MKGLKQFILDLRNASDSADELKRINLELNNVRAKFASNTLNSYQKRKYVSKLLYIHLLGLSPQVSFGLPHAFDLLLSADFQEKQLGYLAVLVLFTHERPPAEHFEALLAQTHACLLADLAAHSADVNAAALNFIASNFNVLRQDPALADEPLVSDASASAEMWLRLIDAVYGVCVAPGCLAALRKRAVVALTVLCKLYPAYILANDNWIPRLLALLDDPDLDVALAAVPLVTLLSELNPAYCKAIVPSVAARLYTLLVECLCPTDFLYYDSPAPWLVIKLLQLVEHLFLLSQLPGSEGLLLDDHTTQRLRNVVSKAIQNASKPVKGLPSRNSRSSILFQAVSISAFLDASPEATNGAVHALVLLLDSVETNTRYLVLDALVKLAARSESTLVFGEHLDKILLSLNDRDISVKRKTLDLLYTVCNETCYTQVISSLLDYFPGAESTLKSDISVKIAVLAERFATDSIWYVSTMLRLLAIGGQSPKANIGADGMSSAGEVWERITQIIVNNEDLQIKATRYVINLHKKDNSHEPENLVKVRAFVIGEFGHKLAAAEPQNPKFTEESQFRILFDSYMSATPMARPILMNALLKFVMHYPDASFVPDIFDLFEAESTSLEVEIQTRALEYLKVAKLFVSGNASDVSLAQALLQPLPPFESKRNRLISQLGSVKVLGARSSSTINVLKIPKQKPYASFNGSTPSIPEQEVDPFGDKVSAPQLSPNWQHGYRRMLQFDAGIFYEDQLIKLTYKIQRDGAVLTTTFNIINNAAKTAAASITALTVQDIHNMSNAGNYIINITKLPDLKVPQRTTLEFITKIHDLSDSLECPILSLSYRCSGSFNTLHLKMPLVLIKTLSGTSMSSIDEFKRRWLQIGEVLGAEKGEKRGTVQTLHRRNSSTIASMLQRLGLAVIQSTPDDSSSNVLVLGAGILRMMKSNYGLLITVKSVTPEAKDFDLIIRSTGEGVLLTVLEAICEFF